MSISSADGVTESCTSTDHRGLKIITTRLTVGGKEQEQTKITWKEEQMVVVSDLEGNKISLTGNIQFDSGSENVYEV